jgi:hypothetical protein
MESKEYISTEILRLAEAIHAAKESRNDEEVLEVLTPQEFPLVAQHLNHTEAWSGNRVITQWVEEYLQLIKAL